MRIRCDLHGYWLILAASDVTIDPHALTMTAECRWDVEPHPVVHPVDPCDVRVLVMRGCKVVHPDPELFDPIRKLSRSLTEEIVSDLVVELCGLDDVAGKALEQQQHVDKLRGPRHGRRIGGGW